MNSLALCFIVKNEGYYAINMIKSVYKLLDVVCFVDTGSTDASVEVVKDFLTGNDIRYFFDKIDFLNFSNARNRSLDLVPNDIENILVLDCDELIEDIYQNKLIELISKDVDNYDGYYLPRINYLKNDMPFDYPDLQLRLFKNKGFRYSGDVHEQPVGGNWFRPEDKFDQLPHISHLKYIQKTSEELCERESLYQAIYKNIAKKNKIKILTDICIMPDPYSFFDIEAYAGPALESPSVLEHKFLLEAVYSTRPKIFGIIGFWQSMEAIFVANKLMSIGFSSPVVCVDTWLPSLPRIGSLSLTLPNKSFDSAGFSVLYANFLMATINSRTQDYILPLQMETISAAQLFKECNVSFDCIYLNLHSDYKLILRDLELWWPLLNDGGDFIFGFDGYDEEKYQAAKFAFDLFFDDFPDYYEEKFRVRKI